MRIATSENRHSISPSRPDALNKALPVPTLNQQRVVSFGTHKAGQIRCVASPESLQARPVRNIFQPAIAIAVEQRHVPLEWHAEAGLGLPTRVLLVRIKHFEVEPCGQLAKPRREVLDRVAGENSEAGLLRCHEWTRMSTNL